MNLIETPCVNVDGIIRRAEEALEAVEALFADAIVADVMTELAEADWPGCQWLDEAVEA
jgi:hypothetical protein